MDLIQIGSNVDWTWGRGSLLNQQFPWHYPQPHTFKDVTAADIWNPKKRVGLYLHTPFCIEKCDYCPYAVRAHQTRETIFQYVQALKKEIRLCANLPSMKDSVLSSIYFGGGSPSILENEWLLELNDLIKSSFDIEPDAEFTVEMNPVDVDEEKLATLEEMDVNRISVGVQSFVAETLHSMRRAHSSDEAVRAFRTIQQFRFKNINLDLIYAYPNQTLEDLRVSLEKAISLRPGRITCASLSIFPKTELYYKVKKGIVKPIQDDQEVEMFNFLVNYMAGSGYELTVVLAFNRPGIAFRQEEDLLSGTAGLVGLGLSAFSVANDCFYSNTSSFAEYYRLIEANQLPITRGRRLDPPTQMAVSVIHGLRFMRIERDRFLSRFGVEIERVYGDKLKKLIDGGLLDRKGNQYTVTNEGMICLGPIMREFYQEPPLFDKTFQGEALPSKPITAVAVAS
jgi:oxygen-independent coproporphyrinogen III oxidase